MLYIILLLAASSSLCVAVTTRTVQLHTAVASATPTVVRNNITSTRTISVPLSHVQTPKPQLPAGWASHSNESAAQNTSHSGDASLASGFGTACCGWGGIFGWTGNGEAVATMAGNCDLASGLPLSSLDLNQCISWDSSSGFVSCGTGGGFLSNGESGCRVYSPPSVWGQAFGAPTYTQIYVVCNGPASNTQYITQMDLNSCIGLDSSGRLSC